jgi:hypothetical protein
VVAAEVRRRLWRVQVLQHRFDAMLALSEARALEYAGDPGGSTGLLVNRGKDANQMVWKFDAALEARIADNLKQAAIEEGQWTEKRDIAGSAGIEVARIELRKERADCQTPRRWRWLPDSPGSQPSSLSGKPLTGFCTAPSKPMRRWPPTWRARDITSTGSNLLVLGRLGIDVVKAQLRVWR